MSVTPEKDPNYIYAHPYATLIADEYRMRGGYCIVRPGGTDDHLMLLTRAGRGLFRTPRGDAVPLAAGSLAVIPPGVPHDYGTDPTVGKWHFLWVHVHAPKDWQPFLGIPFGSGRLTVFARAPARQSDGLTFGIPSPAFPRTDFARIRKADADSTISQPRYGRNQPPLNHDSTILRVESKNDSGTTILHL